MNQRSNAGLCVKWLNKLTQDNGGYMTVKELKKRLEKVPDNTPVGIAFPNNGFFVEDATFYEDETFYLLARGDYAKSN